MTKKSIVLLSFVFLFFSSPLSAQDFYPAKEGKSKERMFGVGGQATYPVAGVSLKFNIGDHAALQGIFGAFGLVSIEVKSLMARGLFRFNETRGVEPYLYAAIGVWTIKETGFLGALDPAATIEETFPGYGIGGGIEYESEKIPDVALNFEIGYGSLRNKKSTFQFSSITYGAGIHYYFMR